MEKMGKPFAVLFRRVLALRNWIKMDTIRVENGRDFFQMREWFVFQLKMLRKENEMRRDTNVTLQSFHTALTFLSLHKCFPGDSFQTLVKKFNRRDQFDLRVFSLALLNVLKNEGKSVFEIYLHGLKRCFTNRNTRLI